MPLSLQDKVGSLLPGVAIAFTIGLAASFLSEHYGAPAMLFALLLGLAMGFLYEDPCPWRWFPNRPDP